MLKKFMPLLLVLALLSVFAAGSAVFANNEKDPTVVNPGKSTDLNQLIKVKSTLQINKLNLIR